MTIEIYTLALIALGLATIFFSFKRLRRYLRYFQQEEYDSKRFIAWLFAKRAFDTRASVLIVIVWLTGVSIVRYQIAIIILSLVLFFLALKEDNPIKSGKKKLVMTERAKRILHLAFLVNVILIAAALFWLYKEHSADFVILMFTLVVSVQLIPYMLVIANLLLSPLEKGVKQKFKNEAVDILKKVSPFTIGITGSYGKTSTKSALGEILNTTLAPTFYPPKSINTEMGITREIRENMKPSHKYAIIEMGAYNVGSIKRLCSFTPPQAGIVTVVGMAHLERYGSEERVYVAKSELAQAIPQDGILVCNGDNAGARKMATEYPKKTTLLYGMQPEKGHLDCIASDLHYTPAGTSFNLSWKGKTYNAFTKLLGAPALSNLLAVFTMACTLGADPEFVIAALRNIEPVDNRLSLSKEGNVSFLRDAYNSNPAGFEAALEVMQQLPAKRKILMTPGMIELGHKQFEENKKAGAKAAKIADIALIVGTTNREALKQGLLENGFNEASLFICDTRDQAFVKLNELMQNDDLILIENDLPDVYEMVENW